MPLLLKMMQKFSSFHVYILVVRIVSIVYCELITIKPENDDLWNDFKNTFNRNYTNDIELTRRPIWEKHMSDIAEHNIGFNNGIHGYSQGINHFSDMTEEEFQNSALGLEEMIECANTSQTYIPPIDAFIPDSINWVELGYVTEVLNQNSCGACWAFSSIASLEGQHKKVTGNLVKLSEQQLIDCSTVTGNRECQGGQMCRAYEYASLPDVRGVGYEQNYPLTDRSGECRYSPLQSVGSTVKGYTELPKGDENALKAAVALVGPIAVGVAAGTLPSFRYYKSGIYDDPLCSNTTVNHAITVVGYGTENGQDYWLIKNSWSTRWGDEGYGKIARNNNNYCGITNKAAFPIVTKSSEAEPIIIQPIEK